MMKKTKRKKQNNTIKINPRNLKNPKVNLINPKTSLTNPKKILTNPTLMKNKRRKDSKY